MKNSIPSFVVAGVAAIGFAALLSASTGSRGDIFRIHSEV